MTDLDEALAIQISEVNRRIARTGVRTDLDEIETAAAAVPAICKTASVGRFVRSLNAFGGKNRLLLEFKHDHNDSQSVILKIYGSHHPNEGPLQQQWANAGLSFAPVISYGDVPTSWVLMPYICGSPPEYRGLVTAKVVAATKYLARLMRGAHGQDTADVEHLPLWQDVGPHWGLASKLLVQHGYLANERWARNGRHLIESGGHVPLHGDLTPKNILQMQGRLIILDTCGHFGPPEFDGARWCARVGGATAAKALADIWLSTDRDLDAAVMRQLLATELLMEAGVREIRKVESGLTGFERDSVTISYIQSSRELFLI